MALTSGLREVFCKKQSDGIVSVLLTLLVSLSTKHTDSYSFLGAFREAKVHAISRMNQMICVTQTVMETGFHSTPVIPYYLLLLPP